MTIVGIKEKSVGFILWEPRMIVANELMFHRIIRNFDLLIALDKKSGDQQSQ